MTTTRYIDRKTGREVAAYIDSRDGMFGFWFIVDGKTKGAQQINSPEKFHARFRPA